MISWKIKHYNELSRDLLYLILKIRQEVFIIEQNCNYLDADSIDESSHHLLGFLDGDLIAYMRIVDPGKIYKNVSFGRILVRKEHRGEGVGHQLMKKAIDFCDPKHRCIVMSAQLYLLEFYKEFDFFPTGEEYLEDNIPHIKMVRNG